MAISLNSRCRDDVQWGVSGVSHFCPPCIYQSIFSSAHPRDLLVICKVKVGPMPFPTTYEYDPLPVVPVSALP